MVKLFSINLNKSEGHAEREARWKKRRENLTILVVVLLFAALSLYTYRNHQALGSVVTARQDQIKEVERRLEELKRTGKDISKGDVLTLARMEKERFLWGTKLKALADILPQDVVVTLLEFTNRQLRIKAISKIMADEREFDKVSQFMEMLKTTPFFYREFTNIRFSESHRVKVEDQEILSITITCSIEKPALAIAAKSTSTKAATKNQLNRSSRFDKESKVGGMPEP
jgi:Tfp pilus assembly protein PilN